MKKLLISILIGFMVFPAFSQGTSQAPKTIHIHSEKRPFIKKGDRKKKKHRHRAKHRMHDKKHFQQNHKK